MSKTNRYLCLISVTEARFVAHDITDYESDVVISKLANDPALLPSHSVKRAVTQFMGHGDNARSPVTNFEMWVIQTPMAVFELTEKASCKFSDIQLYLLTNGTRVM